MFFYFGEDLARIVKVLTISNTLRWCCIARIVAVKGNVRLVGP